MIFLQWMCVILFVRIAWCGLPLISLTAGINNTHTPLTASCLASCLFSWAPPPPLSSSLLLHPLPNHLLLRYHYLSSLSQLCFEEGKELASQVVVQCSRHSSEVACLAAWTEGARVATTTAGCSAIAVVWRHRPIAVADMCSIYSYGKMSCLRKEFVFKHTICLSLALCMISSLGITSKRKS